MMKKIYIADDEKNIRNLISSFLENDGFFVKNFESGDELLKEFYKNPADMLILDIMMDGTDGLTICSEIRNMHNVPIIIVSAKDSEHDRIIGISMGADDYLIKPFSPLELVARVKSIFRRINLSSDTLSTLQFSDIEIDVNSRICKTKNKILDLTPTEFALMVYMFQNSDRAVSREELLKNVWKFDFETDTRATDDVLKRLRKKLINTNVKIASVWGFGFKLEENDGNS
ncbi:MAG: response regulator transcription factor [Clostridia bacterium]